MSDRQGADVNWLVLQALIKSTKSPLSFYFLLQGQLTCRKGKRKRRGGAQGEPHETACCKGQLSAAVLCKLSVVLLLLLLSAPPTFVVSISHHSMISSCLVLSCRSYPWCFSLQFCSFQEFADFPCFALIESWSQCSSFGCSAVMAFQFLHWDICIGTV